MGYKKYPEGHRLATDDCWAKAFDDEMLFILMARDPTAPATVMEWIKMNLYNQPPEKLREAFDCAMEMIRTNASIVQSLSRQKGSVKWNGIPIEIYKPDGNSDSIYVVQRENLIDTPERAFDLHIPRGGILYRKTDEIVWEQIYHRKDEPMASEFVRIYVKNEAGRSEDYRIRVYTDNDGSHLEYYFYIDTAGRLFPVTPDDR